MLTLVGGAVLSLGSLGGLPGGRPGPRESMNTFRVLPRGRPLPLPRTIGGVIGAKSEINKTFELVILWNQSASRLNPES